MTCYQRFENRCIFYTKYLYSLQNVGEIGTIKKQKKEIPITQNFRKPLIVNGRWKRDCRSPPAHCVTPCRLSLRSSNPLGFRV